MKRFEDTRQFLQEVLQAFQSSEDIRLVEQVLDTSLGIQRTASEKLAGMKDAIRFLQSRVGESEQSIASSSKLSQASKVQDLRQQHTELEASVGKMQSDIQSLSQQASQLVETKDTVQTTMDSVCDESELSRIRKALQLYFSITGIHWDLSSPDIKGYITLPQQCDVRKFCHDKEKSSPFDIADNLWKLSNPSIIQKE